MQISDKFFFASSIWEFPKLSNYVLNCGNIDEFVIGCLPDTEFSGNAIVNVCTTLSTYARQGDNGFAFRGNKDNYVHISFLNKIMSMVVKGNFDAPGVLAKARVASNGGITKQWGAYKITKVENTTVGGANKRVYHNVGHDKYTAMCTAYGGGSTPIVYNETATYVDVYANGSFNIILTGDNQ